MKKGFSVGEMLVTLIIVGVVAAMTIPALKTTNTKALKALYKSAYNNVETVINELINDITIYPSGEFINNTFCSNFFGKVNTIGTVNCANTFTSTIPGSPNAVTSNGMRWYNMDNDFGTDTCPDSASGECIKISIDIDGAGKGLNSENADDESRDILHVFIFKTGKVSVQSGTKEAEYLTQ